MNLSKLYLNRPQDLAVIREGPMLCNFTLMVGTSASKHQDGLRKEYVRSDLLLCTLTLSNDRTNTGEVSTHKTLPFTKFQDKVSEVI